MKYCGMVTDKSYWEALRELEREGSIWLYEIYLHGGIKDLEYALDNKGREEKRILK